MRRLTAIAAGAAFAAFPLVRPWGDKAGSEAAMSEAFGDPRWVLAHMTGMAAWGLLSWAAAAGAANPWTARALAAGTALVLPFYGAETFGLHGLAATNGEIAATAEAIRSGAPQSAMFAGGLALLAAGALAEFWRDRRWQTGLLALGVATYLPQFFLDPEFRMAHGMALAAGCVAWALIAPAAPPSVRAGSARS